VPAITLASCLQWMGVRSKAPAIDARLKRFSFARLHLTPVAKSNTKRQGKPWKRSHNATVKQQLRVLEPLYKLVDSSSPIAREDVDWRINDPNSRGA
jgi:hypothetical protein